MGLAKEDTPVYQALNQLKETTDVMLLATLLGQSNGAIEISNSLEIAKAIYADCQHNLEEVAQLSADKLMQYPGVNQVKAATVVAAFQLGLRRNCAEALQRAQIRSSQDCFHIVQPVLSDLAHEEFWVLILNRANKVLGKERISAGGLSGTVVDTKKLYQKVLNYDRVNSIILFHNHPSGNLSPSQADLDVTKKILDAGKLLDIKVLDHLIVAGPKYMSFADEGYI